MSVDYYVIQGVGLEIGRIKHRLNAKKCLNILKEQFDGIELPDEQDFDIDDFLYGNPLDGVGEFLCLCDDTNTMTYADNNAGTEYFYYAPSFPWTRRENEPHSIEEVHQRIFDAVQRVCDMQRYEIEEIINNDIYDFTCG